jgi:FkbM family methyltransferase
MYDVQRYAGSRHLGVIFDIGANVGQTTESLLQYFSKSEIYAFEPVSSTFDALSRRFAGKSQVHALKMALGREPAHAPIRLYCDSELNTLVENGRKTGKTGETETVLVTSVDQICDEHNIHSIDILKMDVQGWELDVLTGASCMLRRKKVHFVFSEVAFRRADLDMQHVGDLSDIMEQNGFWLCGFYDRFRWGANKEYLGFLNALFINPEFSR